MDFKKCAASLVCKLLVNKLTTFVDGNVKLEKLDWLFLVYF